MVRISIVSMLGLALQLCLIPDARAADPIYPNDLLDAQWNLHNIGQPIGQQASKEDADIDAPEAWSIETGTPSLVGPPVLVAILDFGFDVNSDELDDQLWVNTEEENGIAGVDDDQNGCIDDVHGCAFTSDPTIPGAGDVAGTDHGTKVAGVLAAESDNGVEIAGVCWGCRIMPVTIDGSEESFARGLQYAVENGATVVNMSVGKFSLDSEVMRFPIEVAEAMGVILVGSKGNDDRDDFHIPSDWPEVIAVGATDQNDARRSNSNFANVDIVAPGELIRTVDGATVNGTSFAAPQVTGVSALLRFRRPQISLQQIRDILRETADSDIDPNVDELDRPLSDYIGAGRLNAFKALTAVAFFDVGLEAWYRRYTMLAFQHGIIEGFPGIPGAVYLPEQAVTRAEVLKMAYEASGESILYPVHPGPIYDDVSGDDWFYAYVADARSKGYIDEVGKPCSEGSCFYSNEPINRAEAMKILSLLFHVDTQNPNTVINVPEENYVAFPDVDESDWFYEYVRWAANTELSGDRLPNGIPAGQRLVNGYPDGFFRPASMINRAEMAKLVSNMMLFFGSLPALDQFRAVKQGSQTVSIGVLYEQPLDTGNQNAPASLSLPGGNTQTVTQPLTMTGGTHDADGDELFYFWSVTDGSFATTDSENFSSVTWTPPVVANDTIISIQVVRGDRRGLVGRSTFDLRVPGTNSNTAPSGTITAPNGTQTGDVTVSATASDADGLSRVTVTFVPSGTELVLCGSGGTACSGTSGSFSIPNVDPSAFGATAGLVTLQLYVEDATGAKQVVDSHTFTYDPPEPSGPTFTLTVTKQGDGDGTVSGGGINCGPGCASTSVAVAQDSSVTLTGSGADFVGFAGDRCYGAAPCTFTMISDLTVRASFVTPEAFQANSSLPGDGDTGVSIYDNVRVIFNRAIQLGPNQGAIEFAEVGGSAVPFTPAEQSSERRLILNPTSTLEEGTTYRVTIPAGAVQDLSGTSLGSPFSFTFTTSALGAPKIFLTAYPLWIMEGRTGTAHVWFDRPQPYSRTVTITSSPSGRLSHPSQVTIPAGEVIAGIALNTSWNHSNYSNASVTLQVSESGSGSASRSVEIMNRNNISGSSFRYLAASMVDDDNHNGVFEANEDARFRFEVWNATGSTLLNAQISISLVNSSSYGLRLLDDCYIGAIQGYDADECLVDIRADEELPTGEYYLRLDGSSSAGTFLDYYSFSLTNTALPNYDLLRIGSSSFSVAPGTQITQEFVASNRGDGYDTSGPPEIRLTTQIDGEEVLLGKTYAESRGGSWDASDRTVSFVFNAPSAPGSYILRGKINPDETTQETDYSNNESLVTLTVVGPNEAPVIEPPGGPFSVNIGETLSLDIDATDPNGSAVTYSLGAGAPAGMSIHSGTGVLTWTPACGLATGTYTVSVIARDPQLASSSVSLSIQVAARADLRIQKSADLDLAVPGQSLGYTIQVDNLGPSCVTGATVSDIFDANLSGVTWTCSATSGSACASSGAGNIQDNGVNLLAGGVATYTVTATIAGTASGLLSNTATVSLPIGIPDSSPANNTATASTTLRDLDFGDAPDASLGGVANYPTVLASNGARHGVVPGVQLGSLLDGEGDGQPSLTANADDLNGADDEDGVQFLAGLTPCQATQLEVTASVDGFLDGWIDFNANGVWDEPADRTFAGTSLTAGTNSLAVNVPCSAVPGGSVARFRFNTAGGLGSTGLALDGEVEDYTLQIDPILYTLTINTSGVGTGSVIILPGGTACGSSCTRSYPAGTQITLVPSPSVGSAFAGWSGACTGTGNCSVTMTGNRAATAAFDIAPLELSVQKLGDGSCTVTSNPAGIGCGQDCSEVFAPSTSVTLTATAQGGSEFTGWSGAGCSGTGTCTVVMNSPQTVQATCDLVDVELSVTREGAGTGTVTSDPSGIDCGSTCSAAYPFGTAVSLTAQPGDYSVFSGWGAPCSNEFMSCAIPLAEDTNVTARFDTSDCRDDVESSSENWRLATGPADNGLTLPWRQDTYSSHSGTSAWLVHDDQDYVKDQLLTLRSPVQIGAAESSPFLQFWQNYGFDAPQGGAVLEYSLDGGSTWFDVLHGDGISILPNSDRFIQGGYNGQLVDCCENPLPGRQAWTGNANTALHVVTLDLSDFAYQDVLLRWRFMTSDWVIGYWIVDDIQFINTDSCPLLVPLFEDDFETGNDSKWSATYP